MAVFLNDWSESGQAGMIEDFGIPSETLDGCEIIVASYSYENYSGDAFVLYRKNGNLFEVNAGHCSCYGLEGQWEPEETTVEALKYRRYYSDNPRLEDAVKVFLNTQ